MCHGRAADDILDGKRGWLDCESSNSSFTNLTLDLYVSFQFLNDSLANSKSKSTSSLVEPLIIFSLSKYIEKVLLAFSCHSNPCINDLKLEISIV